MFVYYTGYIFNLARPFHVYSCYGCINYVFMTTFQVRGQQTVDGQVFVGVSAHGLAVYKDKLAVYRWPWQKILHFSYTRNGFKITIRPKVKYVLKCFIGWVMNVLILCLDHYSK
jgi:hypothetical protein